MCLQYHSIPQSNTACKLLAIRSLAVYASVCRYFVSVAPTCNHHDAVDAEGQPRVCGVASYQRRGWCRLEQMAYMTFGDTAGMFLYTGEQQSPVQVVEAGQRSQMGETHTSVVQTPMGGVEGPPTPEVRVGSGFAAHLHKIEERHGGIEAAIDIFNGDFTDRNDRKLLAKTVLGLWYQLLVQKGKTAADGNGKTLWQAYEAVQRNKATVFPRDLFGQKIEIMESRFHDDNLAAGKSPRRRSLSVPRLAQKELDSINVTLDEVTRMSSTVSNIGSCSSMNPGTTDHT